MSQPAYGIASDIHLHNWSAFHKVLPTGENDRLMISLNALHSMATFLHDRDMKRLYIAGDLFHVRGKITPSVLNPTLKVFAEIVKLVEVRIIPGNHDLESDDSQELTNATQALQALGCVVVTEPTYFEDDDVFMVPWEPSLSELKKTLKQGQADHSPETAIIHAPLNGVIPGIPDHGLEAKELSGLGYKFIFCGHYHNYVDFGNGVFSIGALTHLTWNDVNTIAGYLIIDADREVHQYETNAPRFVDYDESLSNEQAAKLCAGNYVRVKLGEASEKEIQVIRELVQSEYEARGVTVHAQPKRTTTARKATITAGASLGASVNEYIEHSETSVDKDLLSRECETIMAEADNGEDD